MKTSKAPAARTAAQAEEPKTNVSLQATFVIPRVKKEITINTQDIANAIPKKGQLKFNLSQPQELGSIQDGLDGVWELFKLPGTAPQPSNEWPEPFAALADADLTVTRFCIDQPAGTWAFGMSIKEKEDHKLMIPIVDIEIKEIGFQVNKGQCPVPETTPQEGAET